MLSKEDFKKAVIDAVNEQIGDGHTAELITVDKVNIRQLEAIVVVGKAGGISPNFYVDRLYQDYVSSRSTPKEVASHIVGAYQSANKSPNQISALESCLRDRDWVKGRLFLQVVNKARNRELLKDAVYQEDFDLAFVLYVLVKNEESGFLKVKITKQLFSGFGWDEGEIMAYALENTMRLFPWKHMGMLDTLRAMHVPEEEMCSGDMQEMVGAQKMTVLTNNRGICGAIAAFYPGVLKGISENMGAGGLFILPSSIHETIILKDDGVCDPSDLSEIVKAVNQTEVSDGDYLSDSVYYYDSGKDRVSVLS